ncbi:MAG: hypothetical protein ACTHMV_15985 [Chitinophagaceae bacterium]
MELNAAELKHIDSLVRYFKQKSSLFDAWVNVFDKYFNESKQLKPFIHTIKSRVKDPEHLRGKLIRKTKQAWADGQEYEITRENLFHRINDLVGFRIIHLHTRQIAVINRHLKALLREKNCKIIEGPEAKTWDDESRGYFESLGFSTVGNKNMYTSIHYVIQPSPEVTCEIQIRTLMEEVWGEVDHTINYPDPTESISCREQIKTLARVTSSCSRLVDSIFATEEYEKTKAIRQTGIVSEKKTTNPISKKKRKQS